MAKLARDVQHNGYQALYEPAVSTAVTTVTSTEIMSESIHEALHLGTPFISVAKRGGSSLSQHRLSWFTGNNKARGLDGRALPDIAGWAIEQPDLDETGLPEDYELYDAMALLVQRGLAAECVVLHPDDSGKPRPVRYWAMPQLGLFVVCEGVPSKQEMLRDPAERWGVAYAWPQGRSSELHLIAFSKELMDAGYCYPLSVKFSSYCTDRALACLKAHERVLNVADKFREEAGEHIGAAYYAYALPIGVSPRSITAGKDAGKTKEIYYPFPVVPRQIDLQYLSSVAISRDQALLLEEDGRVERTVAWSVEKSRRIMAGNEASEVNDEDHPF
ncbi:hypothetical protein KTT_41280 [Tengunoibacter tsumagoiensis]|uniref:Uncharacterized protein n=2 Tax=Tengunoibacter tsumagoiensis TaxID=2014871 RepID=A0A402A5C3_9CHLR|nr:hypothetical protein KTT_40740 [Tengunoibacter tsumagoiensis]GCE14269.1 hypothetical protein KTT_41280 [Tengunoibacter tsumagoiensis]